MNILESTSTEYVRNEYVIQTEKNEHGKLEFEIRQLVSTVCREEEYDTTCESLLVEFGIESYEDAIIRGIGLSNKDSYPLLTNVEKDKIAVLHLLEDVTSIHGEEIDDLYGHIGYVLDNIHEWYGVEA